MSFLLGGYSSSASEQDKHRAIMINSLFAFGFCFTFFTGIVRLLLKEYTVALIDFAWTIVIFGILSLFHRLRKYNVVATVLVSLLSLMFMILFAYRASNEAIFVWYYSVPLIAVFLLGAKRGLVLSLVHIILTAIYMIFFAGNWNTTVYEPELTYRFLSSYFVVISFAFLFQWLKERNISILQQKTDELSETKVSLEQANRAKRDFLTKMSHELRTPLNHIIGFTELSYDGSLGDIGEPHKEHLGYVLESSRHLLSLIEDILDMSRIEAGKLQLNLEWIHLDEFLGRCLEMFGETASLHRINLSLENKCGAKAIRADKRKLKQIVYNLVSNAMKFAEDGGDVSIRASTQGDEAVTFCVSDTGQGIDSTEMGRVFDPFFQVQKDPSTTVSGTGLGLALTKELVELHGGRLWVESAGLGKGSAFFFTIPT